MVSTSFKLEMDNFLVASVRIYTLPESKEIILGSPQWQN